MNIVTLLLFKLIVALIERIAATQSAVVPQILKSTYYRGMVWISCTEATNL